jgi:hypothetical protein
MEKKSKKKLTKEQVNIIKKYQSYPDKKLILQLLKEKHQIQTSLTTMQKIWKGTY